MSRHSWHDLAGKIDGNDLRPSGPTNVFVQELSLDGMSLTGTRRAILTHARPWEGDVIEGGWLLRRGEPREQLRPKYHGGSSASNAVIRTPRPSGRLAARRAATSRRIATAAALSSAPRKTWPPLAPR
jgi:hypothetical protein